MMSSQLKHWRMAMPSLPVMRLLRWIDRVDRVEEIYQSQVDKPVE
jgi:hypothetical protein